MRKVQVTGDKDVAVFCFWSASMWQLNDLEYYKLHSYKDAGQSLTFRSAEVNYESIFLGRLFHFCLY